jgi:hypothetical protein
MLAAPVHIEGFEHVDSRRTKAARRRLHWGDEG